MNSHENNRRFFAILLIVIELIVLVIYGIFVRPIVHNDLSKYKDYYPIYQDINAIMLIGFGFAMAFVKNHSWSSITYTFFINAIIVQLYIPLSAFWKKMFEDNWDFKIHLQEKTFTAASYSVASILVAFGAVLGRVGPLQLLVMGLVQVVGYTLNDQIIKNQLNIFDVGGSMTRHTFGAYFGLTVSLILSRVIAPKQKPKGNYYSNIFSMIGTLFLWMYWPISNSSHLSDQPYYRSVVIFNTVLALTGSCVGTFIMTSLVREKFYMGDICNATLAGGVAISSSCGLFINPAGPLFIGIFTSVITTLGYRFLQQKLHNSIGLYDSCGIHNLHAIPGVLAGIFSAIAIASYESDPLSDNTQISYLPFYPQQQSSNINIYGRTFYQQGGFQIVGIFVSMGIGIVFGIIAGYLIRMFYAFNAQQFYNDSIYFMELQEQQTPGDKADYNDTFQSLNISVVPNILNKTSKVVPLQNLSNKK